ncbi:unnamed protein product [Anisakis simplex]|uniref:Methyl-accepting chemotaxis protein n=1 Tax=Anisakis simplex TaxID=6269 RepID=A0A0M3JNE6_ANISI|nr:unnamed protein product [Anisakis simplex]
MSLLSRGAQLEAAAEAALKQAEGASRAAKTLMASFHLCLHLQVPFFRSVCVSRIGIVLIWHVLKKI